MAVVLLPRQLENEAGGRRFEVDGATLRAALEALPVADLLFDERGALRPLVHLFVDGVDARGALDEPLAAAATIRVVAAIAGG